MNTSLRDTIEGASGSAVVRMDAVRGGDFAAAYRVDLADGRRLFAKTHTSPPPGFFTTEAAGLEWLRAADAVPVPRVVGVDDGSPAMLLTSFFASWNLPILPVTTLTLRSSDLRRPKWHAITRWSKQKVIWTTWRGLYSTRRASESRLLIQHRQGQVSRNALPSFRRRAELPSPPKPEGLRM